MMQQQEISVIITKEEIQDF